MRMTTKLDYAPSFRSDRSDSGVASGDESFRTAAPDKHLKQALLYP